MSISVEHSANTLSWLNRTQYPFKSHYFDAEGGRMHYVDEGQGEPIVFIHGLPTWSFVYRHLIRGLSPDFRCIAPDLIGFGLSDKPADWSYSPLAQSMNIERLIDSLGLEKVTLVLHDFGAPLGMSFAVDFPHRVSRIVSFNSFCWDLRGNIHAERVGNVATSAAGRLVMTSINSWPKLVRRMFGDRSKFTETFENAIAGPASSKEERIGLWSTAKCFATCGPFFQEVWSRRRELQEIPFQFIWGMRDAAFGENSLNKWWHEFPLAEVERMSGVGHFPMEEQPAEVLRAVREFVMDKVRRPYML